MKASIEATIKAGLIVDEEKFISECCLNFGAGRRYVLEYLRDLENTNFLIRKAGEIWTPEALRADEILNHVESKDEEESQEVKQ